MPISLGKHAVPRSDLGSTAVVTPDSDLRHHELYFQQWNDLEAFINSGTVSLGSCCHPRIINTFLQADNILYFWLYSLVSILPRIQEDAQMLSGRINGPPSHVEIICMCPCLGGSVPLFLWSYSLRWIRRHLRHAGITRKVHRDPDRYAR